MTELENYSITDHLAVRMRVILTDIKYYEYDDSGDITVEYEVSAKEASFLPLDSIETKLARNGYFVAGNMINFKNGLSIYIAETGYLNNNGISCAYVKVEATNHGTEEVYMPNPDFYGDDYALERSYLANDSDVKNGMSLAPGRKVQGYYCAKAGNNEFSVIEADLSGAIVMIQYTKSDMDDISPKAIAKNLGHSTEIVTVDNYIDKSKLSVIKLDKLDSFIDSVVPKTNCEEEDKDFSKVIIDVSEFF